MPCVGAFDDSDSGPASSFWACDRAYDPCILALQIRQAVPVHWDLILMDGSRMHGGHFVYGNKHMEMGIIRSICRWCAQVNMFPSHEIISTLNEFWK